MVSFGGLVINYLQVSQREAYLLSNDELSDALAVKLATFKIFLEIVMFCSLGGYGALALWRGTELVKQHRDRVKKKCVKFFPCCRRVCQGGAAAIGGNDAENGEEETKGDDYVGGLPSAVSVRADDSDKRANGGWTTHTDSQSGRTYRHHSSSGKTEWIEEDSGRIKYFENAMSPTAAPGAVVDVGVEMTTTGCATNKTPADNDRESAPGPQLVVNPVHGRNTSVDLP